jgi:uncharacterized protein (DUF2336 family)
MADDSAGRDTAALAAQLEKVGRLTGTLLLRALYAGDLEFFTHGLAQLAKMPAANVQQMVRDPRQQGLKALYQQSGLPARLLAPAQIAIAVASDMHYEGDPAQRQHFVERAIVRLKAQFGRTVPTDDIDWLIDRLMQPRDEVARPESVARH